MKTIQETRKEAISVINNIIVLKTNVANMCPTSREELEIELPRLEKIKKWAKANNQIQEIRLYLVQKTFGQHLQFAAADVATFFHN